MNLAMLAWTHLRAKPPGRLLDAPLWAPRTGRIGFVQIVDGQTNELLERDAGGIALVVRAEIDAPPLRSSPASILPRENRPVTCRS